MFIYYAALLGCGKTKTAITMLNTLHVVKYLQHYESIIDMLLYSMHSQAITHIKQKLLQQTTQSRQQKPQPNKSFDKSCIDLTTDYYTKPPSSAQSNRTNNKAIVISDSNNDLSSILNSMAKPNKSRSPSPIIPTNTNSNSNTGDINQPNVIAKPRFLICAPSNTAVDELISRVLSNFVDGQLNIYKPDIVRIGNTDAMRNDVKQIISLDAIVDTYLQIDPVRLQHKVKHSTIEIQKIDSQMFQCHMEYYKLLQSYVHRKQLIDIESITIRSRELASSQFITNIVKLHERRYRMHVDVQRYSIALQYNQCKEQLILNNVQNLIKLHDTPQMLLLRDQLKLSILNTSHIVFCTLSGAGLELLTQIEHTFDILLLDEAAAANELSTLVALKHNATHTILIGDSNQLPATAFDKLSISKQYYERSLFERLQQSGYSTLVLNTQYRMHPQIASFPSSYFYSQIGGLTNGQNVYSTQYQQLYHTDINYQPYLFWNIECNKIQRNPSGSLYNSIEATFIIKLIINLLCHIDSTINPCNIVVITFYSFHRIKMYELITAMNDSVHSIQMSDVERDAIVKLKSIDICTVDSYQGRENDIVIISCVRSSGGNDVIKSNSINSIGFISDIRRMNVSLTRARYSCWIVGDSNTLQHDHHWNELINNAKQRNLYRQANDLFQTHSESVIDDHNSSNSSATGVTNNKQQIDTSNIYDVTQYGNDNLITAPSTSSSNQSIYKSSVIYDMPPPTTSSISPLPPVSIPISSHPVLHTITHASGWVTTIL